MSSCIKWGQNYLSYQQIINIKMFCNLLSSVKGIKESGFGVADDVVFWHSVKGWSCILKWRLTREFRHGAICGTQRYLGISLHTSEAGSQDTSPVILPESVTGPNLRVRQCPSLSTAMAVYCCLPSRLGTSRLLAQGLPCSGDSMRVHRMIQWVSEWEDVFSFFGSWSLTIFCTFTLILTPLLFLKYLQSSPQTGTWKHQYLGLKKPGTPEKEQ